MFPYCGVESTPVYHSVLNVKAVVATFNQEKALVVVNSSKQCVTCGGGEELLPVCDGVPLGGAVGEAGVVDAVDDREHSHQAVVAMEGQG